MMHGCTVYTVSDETATVSGGTSHATTKQRLKYPTSVDIQNVLSKAIVNHLQSRVRVEVVVLGCPS